MTTQPPSQPQDFRPSPYRADRSFRFSVVLFKICGATGFVFGGLGVFVFCIAAWNGAVENLAAIMNATAYLILGGAIFASLSFLLSMIADIEQHAFRAAQQLNKIVESQARKKTNAS